MKLRIEKTETTPEVDFNLSTGSFSMKGNFAAKDSFAFYNPIIDWLKEFVCSSDESNIELQLEVNHFGFHDETFLVLIIMMIKGSLNESGIKWFYMSEVGEDDGKQISQVCEVPFEFVSVEMVADPV